ncbi:IS21 family transposase [bacterium]|nr:MAG: IS21 family transposase [bacterium]RKZ12357.1 MAG: IS21 family transposase [bacterium]
MITDAQVRLLRQKRMDGTTQEAAAAASAMSERSARKWETGPLPSQTQKKRGWRTREDPFAAVWEPDVIPLLASDEEGILQATTVLAELQARHEGKFGQAHLRTLQRRMRQWRALHGPDKDVIFLQEHPPGREAALDFTHCKELGVTIAGEPFVHLLFVFKMSFSSWTWVQLAFGETFEALVAGLQGALWALGGVPEVVRHDNLSAATHELRRSGGRALTRRFADVLDHYGLRSTRINPGQSHENGVVERGNGLLKSALRQALIVRGSRDFASTDEYLAFVRQVAERSASPERFTLEHEQLRPLPTSALPDYTTHHATVRRWSTVRMGSRSYSVPSRLIGHKVELRQHANHLEVYYADHLIETMPRVRGEVTARIDYRHIIGSLVRKPGAFARYRYREELFPSLTFREAYDRLCDWRGQRADVEYVRILDLAARTMESQVERALRDLLESKKRFDYAAVQDLAHPGQRPIPVISIAEPSLEAYDRLVGGMR